LRGEAARRFAARNTAMGASTQMAAQAARAIEESALRALDVFHEGGLVGITEFLESNVPKEELPRAAEVVVRLLGGAMGDLRIITREQAGLAPLRGETEEQRARDDNWLRLSLAAL